VTFIPVNTPRLDGNEERYLVECVRTGWVSSEGPFVGRLEEAMAQRLGRAHGVAVANGSVALEAAVAALRLGPGDEVILPTFTIISCVAPIVRCGATPVLVDCDPVTWTMDVAQVEARVTPRTRAVMAVHIYGLPVDMGALETLAERHGFAILEDAAEGLGITCAGRPCGGFGRLSTLSFYPNKLVTTGEGGMVLTDEDDLAARLRSLRNLCFLPERRFVHEELGWNFRMSNVQAALGVAQLERLDASIAFKRAVGRRYEEGLSGLVALQRPAPRAAGAENVYWVYGVVLADDVPFDAATAMARLAERGVGTRPFFWPLHEQPVLRARGLFAGERHRVAERIARRGFYLPSGLGLPEADQARVVKAVREVLG
jgi:perosamine synthetase